MRMTRLRLTVRWLMLGVAAVAILLTAGIVGRRWASLVVRGGYHARQEARFTAESLASFRKGTDESKAGQDGKAVASYANALRQLEMRSYHGRLRKEYDRARWTPWRPVPPDPPPPEWPITLSR
jgi:hypothetical protein